MNKWRMLCRALHAVHLLPNTPCNAGMALLTPSLWGRAVHARMLATLVTACALGASPVVAPFAGSSRAWLNTELKAQSSPATSYDPMRATGRALAPIDLDVRDANRNRTLPIRVYRPAGLANAPVLLFSHGLGGARTNNPYLGEHWAARGYVVVYVQHPGSDESVWKDTGPLRRMAAMRRAASAQNFTLRVADVPAVIDALAAWNAQAGHVLAGALDLTRLGMSGHSFGALTTQAVSGQAMPNGRTTYQDPRIRAAVIMSPSAPRNASTSAAFGKVDLPWLLMTGTQDEARIGDATVENRLSVYPALPTGRKYELVLHDAEHSAFGDRPLPGDKDGARNPNHHRAILATSTAFWDAYLLGDPAARTWLDGASVRTVLEPKDRWQRK